MTTEAGKPSTRPWPLKPWCLHTSWIAALIAFLLLLSAPTITLVRHEHDPSLWVIVPLWAICYGLVVAVAYGMALIARDMPPSFLFRNIIPEPAGKLLDTIYGAMANIVLILAPLLMIKLGLFVLLGVLLS